MVFFRCAIVCVIGWPCFIPNNTRKNPDIIFQIVAESNILDVHKPMKDLTISFRGNDIQETKQNLKFYIISVRNDGDKNVVQNDYDQNQIWGLEFKNSKIIETPQVIDSNSEYLKKYLTPKVLNENIVELSKVIFEKGKYATIEIKILHDIGKDPEISVRGKIAGVEKQTFNISSLAGQTQSFWQRLFKGDFLVQIARIIIYFLGFIISFIALIFLFELPSIWSKKYHNKKLRNYLTPILSKTDESGQEKILSFCKLFSGNISEMEAVLALLDDKEELKELEQILKREKEDRKLEEDKFIPFRVYNVNVRDKVFSVNEKGEISIDRNSKRLLDDALEYIKKAPPPEKLKWDLR